MRWLIPLLFSCAVVVSVLTGALECLSSDLDHEESIIVVASTTMTSPRSSTQKPPLRQIKTLASAAPISKTPSRQNLPAVASTRTETRACPAYLSLGSNSSLPVCLGGEDSRQGAWVRGCIPEGLSAQRWTSSSSYALRETPMSQTRDSHGGQCYANNSRLSVLEYHWVPRHCSLPRWDGAQFARLAADLGGILFVGDSLMKQFASSLFDRIPASSGNSSILGLKHSNILVNLTDYSPVPAERLRACIKANSCSLYKPPNATDRYSEYVLRQKVDHLRWTVSLEHFGVLVFNIGYHWRKLQDHGKWGPHGYTAMVKNFIAFLDEYFPLGRVIFLMFPGGTPGCDRFHQPHAPNFRYTSTEESRRWAWEETEAVQLIWKQEFGASKTRLFIDGDPLKLRGDSRPTKDCLHFCVPGPLDVQALRLFAALRTLRNSKKQTP